MSLNMPEIKKMYVIGNGFDKHHSIECGYNDFKKWLRSNRKLVYENLIRIYGNLTNDWWSKFEESLTDFDPDKFPYEVADATFFEQLGKLAERYGEEGRTFIDDYELINGTVSNQYERAAEIARFEMRHLKEDLCEAFGEWVKSIKLPDVLKKDCNLDARAFFFTFNYTRTLEDLYEIEEDQVVHLHGSVDDGNFVIGHNMTAEEMLERDLKKHMYDRNPDDDKGEDEARISMFDVAEELKKPVEDIIQKHSDDFYSLESVEDLEVLGFSYSPIDLPYLERIIEVTGRDINVRLSWHDEKEDKINAESFARKMRLSNYEIFEF